MGVAVDSIYSSGHGGYIVRRIRANGSKYYVVYSDAGEELSGPMPEETVYPFRMEFGIGKGFIPDGVIFFERIDQQRNLYWPIQFDGTHRLEKPANLLGLRPPRGDISHDKLNFIDEYIGEFDSGRYLSYQKGKLPYPLADRLSFLTDRSAKIVGADAEDILMPKVYGGHYTLKAPVLTLENEIHVPSLKKSFTDRAELTAFIPQHNQRVLLAVQEEKAKAK